MSTFGPPVHLVRSPPRRLLRVPLPPLTAGFRDAGAAAIAVTPVVVLSDSVIRRRRPNRSRADVPPPLFRPCRWPATCNDTTPERPDIGTFRSTVVFPQHQ